MLPDSALRSLLILGLATLLAGPLWAQDSAMIRGTVQSETGGTLPGATVRLDGTTRGDVTGLDGTYAITGLAPGTYRLVATFVGYAAAVREVTVAAGETGTANFTLAERALFLEGLVVTAQKRAQAIQDVPVALTSYGGDFLESIGVQELDNFAAYVPGLEVQIQSPNNPGFVVRGITSDDGDARVEPRVSVFQDGVSISKSRGSVVELFDLERVEVLKGPQGTLFGRGAQIGAVHIIQNKPTGRLDGSVTLGTGNYGELFGEGFVNVPVVPGRLFARVAGIYNERDGYIENVSGGTLNGKETGAVRASLRWLPTDATVVDLIANYQQDTPPGTSFKSGTFAPGGGDTDPTTAADLERGDDLGLDRTVWGVTLLTDYALTDVWTLEGITAYREFDSYESFDADGTAAPALWFAEDAQGQQFSQEVRATYEGGGRLSGFGGASVFWEDGSQRVPFETDERSLLALFSPLLQEAGALPVSFPLVIGGAPNVLPQFDGINPVSQQPFKTFHREQYENFGTTTALEVFADGTYAVLPRLDVTAGLRFTYEDVTGAYEVTDSETPGTLGIILGVTPNNLFAPTDGRRKASETFTSVVGRLATNYRVTGETNVFATVARGRRPNVVQVTATEVNILNDEIVWSYEAGLRGLALDERLQFDASAFYYDYFNFQTDVTELTPDGLVMETRDSGNATAQGFETSFRVALLRPLSVFANYGYIDATFDEEDADDTPQELAGNTFRLTPKHSLSAGLNLEVGAGPVGTVFFRPTYTYKSEVYFEEENAPDVRSDAFGLLDVRAGVTLPGKRFELEGFVENALDEEYIIDAGNTGGTFGIPTYIAGPPRLVGVRLTARY